MIPRLRGLALSSFLAAGLGVSAATAWRPATDFEVEGRGWTNTASPYHRLPVSAKARVPEAVWNLSRQSAGLAVRFVAHAAQVKARWTLSDANLAMPHMPATGVSGLDLYERDATGRWVFVQNGRPAGREGNVVSFDLADGGRDHECLLYLPLYNGVESLEVGVEDGASIRPPAPRPEDRRRPVVVYGTSIVQGACASRPGLAHVAVLGRMLDRPMVNLGFSGSGKMEAGVAQVVAELDPAAFVVDCLWNVSEPTPEAVEQRVAEFLRILRAAHPETPVILVGQSHLRPDRHPTSNSRAQEKVFRALRDAGDRRLGWVDGASLLGVDGEGTVDGVHPNDLGMLRQAEALLPALRAALGTR